MKEIFDNWRGFLLQERDWKRGDIELPPGSWPTDEPSPIKIPVEDYDPEGLELPSREEWEKENPKPEIPTTISSNLGYPHLNGEPFGPPLEDYFNWRTRPRHAAADFRCPVGTPVLAIGDGVVTAVSGWGAGSKFHKTWRNKLVPEIYRVSSSLLNKIKAIKPSGKSLTHPEVVSAIDGEELRLWKSLKGKSVRRRLTRLKKMKVEKYKNWSSFRQNMRNNTVFTGKYREYAAQLWRRKKFGSIGGSIIYVHHQSDDIMGAGGEDPIGGAYNFGYMHLETKNVSKGQVVKKGEVLGTVGNTAVIYSKTHLHLQVVPAIPVLDLNKARHPHTHGKKSKRLEVPKLINFDIMKEADEAAKDYERKLKEWERRRRQESQDRPTINTDPRVDRPPAVAPRTIPRIPGGGE